MTTNNNPPQPTLGGDGRYCVHHDDDPAHTKECYEPELAPQPADVAGVPIYVASRVDDIEAAMRIASL